MMMNQDNTKSVSNTADAMAITNTMNEQTTTYGFSFSQDVDVTDVNGQKTFCVSSMTIKHQTNHRSETAVQVRFGGRKYNSTGTKITGPATPDGAYGYPSEADFDTIKAAVEKEVSFEHWDDIESSGFPQIDIKAGQAKMADRYGSQS